jgi:hypothetical protein
MTLNYDMLSVRESLSKFFDIVNSAQLSKEFHITPSEIKLLIEFILLPPKFKHHRFSSAAKMKVRKICEERYDWTLSAENVNNKIYSLLTKSILFRDEDSVVYLQPYIESACQGIISASESDKNYILTFKFSPVAEDRSTNKENSEGS